MSSRSRSGRVALAFEDKQYTYAQLDALAVGLAAMLAERGVKPGDRVALMSSNRPEWVVAVQAIWRLGAAVVLFSPAWKQTETEHALTITQPAHAVGDHLVLAALMPMLHLDEPITPVPGATGPAANDPQAEAVLVFSSGTTGLPKAVRHTHGSLRAAIGHWRDALELTEEDRIQVTTPPSHILGLLNIATALELGVWMRLHRRFDLDPPTARANCRSSPATRSGTPAWTPPESPCPESACACVAGDGVSRSTRGRPARSRCARRR